MSLIAELKRRNVFRVGAAYAIVGWLLLEVASVLRPELKVLDFRRRRGVGWMRTVLSEDERAPTREAPGESATS